MSFQIYFTDKRRRIERIRVCVADSEEEFRNTTVEELKRKLIPEDQLEDTILVNYYEKTLKKNRTLGFYGIKHEDYITAVRRGSSYTVKIQLQSSHGHKFTESFTFEDDDDDEDKGKELPRSESMDISMVIPMQQIQ
ncbi:uncharacterized protein LOC143738894 isoform X2 [Siphateles boraxobius]|uniref:uncharacterized protein LOC143738894 isoform X2 n=1 Tax=Siphateles boraxobius TaxID=180520 RepID=UPI004063DDDA